ncbi:MAG: hypothetical protein AAF563_05220 [Pseudomonadota bacterium]
MWNALGDWIGPASNALIIIGVAIFYVGVTPPDVPNFPKDHGTTASRSKRRVTQRLRWRMTGLALLLLIAGFVTQPASPYSGRLHIIRMFDGGAELLATILVSTAVLLAATWWHATDRMHRYRWQDPELYRIVDFRQDIGLSARTNMVALGMIALAFILCALAA